MIHAGDGKSLGVRSPQVLGLQSWGHQEAGEDETSHKRAMANANVAPATRPEIVATDSRGRGLCVTSGESECG